MLSADHAEGSVLIIDEDESIRQMLAALLSRAGFRTKCAEASDAIEPAEFDVIIRDVNLAPARRAISLSELQAVPTAVMERTVITTTALSPALRRATPGQPFAVVRKPFDVMQLVETVRRCRNRVPNQPLPVDVDRLQRFVQSAPRLGAILGRRASSIQEMQLRSEMRDTLRELSKVLDEAAQSERDRSRSATLSSGARAADDLVRLSTSALRPVKQGH